MTYRLRAARSLHPQERGNGHWACRTGAETEGSWWRLVRAWVLLLAGR